MTLTSGIPSSSRSVTPAAVVVVSETGAVDVDVDVDVHADVALVVVAPLILATMNTVA